MNTKQSYAIVFAPEVQRQTLQLPAGCRVVEWNESPELIEDEGGPAAIVEWDNDDVDPLDVPGIRKFEPL